MTVIRGNSGGVTPVKFEKEVNAATADNRVTKKELDGLKKTAMADGKLDTREQDSFYQMGLNGMCRFELNGKDKVETLISAGMLEKKGKWQDAVKLLEKNGFTDKADEIKARHTMVAFNPVTNDNTAFC